MTSFNALLRALLGFVSGQGARRALLGSTAVIAGLAAPIASAQTWDGSTDGNWGTSDNWSSPSSVPNGTNDSATFDSDDGAATAAVDLGGATFVIEAVNFTDSDAGNATSTTYTISNGTLDFQGNNNAFDIDGDAQDTVNVSTDFAVSNSVLEVTTAAGKTFNLSGALALTDGLEKLGNGTMFASGAISGAADILVSGGLLTLSAANTWTGDATIDGGTLDVSSGTAIDDTATVTINNAGTLQVTASETIGTLASSSGTAVTNIDASQVLTIGGMTANGTYSGVLTGDGTLEMDSNGFEFTLDGNSNAFAGDFLITDGILDAEGDNAIGDTSVVTVEAGGMLRTSNFSTETIGALVSDDATATVNVQSNTTLTVGGMTTDTIYAGQLTGGGLFELDSSGQVLTLSGSAEAFTGNVLITAGVLNAQGGAAIDNASVVTVDADGTLRTSNFSSETIGALVASSNSATVNVQNNTTLTVGGMTADTTYAGQLTGGGLFELDSAGQILTLSGNSESFTGNVTVTNGILNATGNNAIDDASIVTVEAGGTLRTSSNAMETIGALVATSNAATVNVQNNTTLTVGGMLADSTFAGQLTGGGLFEMGSAGSVLNLTGNSETFTGNVLISAGTLNVTGGSAIDDASTVTLTGAGTLDVSATETIGSLVSASTNAVVNLDAGQSLNVSGMTGDATYSGGLTGTGTLNMNSSLTELLLNGNNDAFTGSYVVTNGVLDAEGGSAIGDTSVVTVEAGGMLRVSNLSDETIGSLVATSNAATVNVQNNTTLTVGGMIADATYAGQLTGGGLFEMGSAGRILTLSGNSEAFTGSYLISAGTLNASGGNAIDDASVVTLTGTGELNVTNSEIIGSLVSGSSNAVVDINAGQILTVGNMPADATYSGSLAGTGTLFMNSNADQLTLDGNNSGFTGTVSGGDGTLAVENAFGGTIQVAGGTVIVDTSAAYSAAAVDHNGGTLVVGTDLSAGVTADLNAATIGAVTGETHTITGITSDQILTYGTATQDGTIIVDGAVTQTAASIIEDGTLQIGSASAAANLLSAGVTINANGTLDVAGTDNVTVGNLTGAGAITNSSLDGTAETLIATNSADTTFSGSIGAEIDLDKQGASQLTLTGTISGDAVVTAGTLVLDGSGAMQDVTVNAGTFTIADDAATVAQVTNNNAGAITNNNGTVTTVVNTNGTFNNLAAGGGQAAGIVSGNVTVNGGVVNNQAGASMASTGGTEVLVTSGTLVTPGFNNFGTAGQLTVNGGVAQNHGTGVINGNVVATGGGIFVNDGDVNGETTIQSLSQATAQGGDFAAVTVENGGTLNVSADTTLTGTLTNNNNGLITTNGSASLFTIGATGQTIVNQGTISATGGRLRFNADELQTSDNATITGNVLFVVDTLTNTGTLTLPGGTLLAAAGDYVNGYGIVTGALQNDGTMSLSSNLPNAFTNGAPGIATIDGAVDALGNDVTNDGDLDLNASLTGIGTFTNNLTTDVNIGTLEANAIDNSGTGILTLDAGTTVSATGAALDNTGIINMASGSVLQGNEDIDNAGTINVNASATINANMDNAGGDALNNTGDIITAGGGVVLTVGDGVGTDIVNNGANGTITITAGDTLTGSAVTLNNGGAATATINVGTGSTLDIATLNNTDNGELNNDGALSVTTLTTTSGSTINNTSNGSITGAFTSNGTVNNTGTVSGNVDIAGGTFGHTGGDLAGTMTVSGGTLDMSNGAATGFVDVTGGTFDFSGGTLSNQVDVSAGQMNVNGGTVAPTIAVAGGTLDVGAGTATSVTQSGGTVNVTGGTVTTAALTGGTFEASSGSVTTLTNNGSTDASTSGAGSVGTLINTSGTFTNSGAITGTATVNGGILNSDGTAATINNEGGTVRLLNGSTTTAMNNNSGDLSILSGAVATTVTNSAAATNAGETVNVETLAGDFRSSGTITNTATVNGGQLTNLAAGVLSATSTVNSGTLRNLGTITGDVELNGGQMTQVSGTSANVTNLSGTVFVNGGTMADLTNSAVASTSGSGTVTLLTQTAGTFANAGTTTTADVSGGTFTTTGTAGSVNTIGGDVIVDDGTVATLTHDTGTSTINAAGTVTNLIVNGDGAANAGTVGTATLTSGSFDTSGTITTLAQSGGTSSNTGTIGALNQTGGTATNSGDITGTATISGGQLDVESGGSVTALLADGAGAVANIASGGSAGSVAVTDGTVNQAGTVTGTTSVTGGTLANTGTLTGTTTVDGGSLTASGAGSDVGDLALASGSAAISGGTTDAVTMTGGTLTTSGTGTLASLSQSAGTATLGGTTTGTTALSGTAQATNAGTLNGVTTTGASTFTNAAGGTAGAVTNAGTYVQSGGSVTSLANQTSGTATLSGGTITGTASNIGALQVTGGTVTASIINGIDGVTTIADSGTLTGNINNQSGGTLALAGTVDGTVSHRVGAAMTLTDGATLGTLNVYGDLVINNQLNVSDAVNNLTGTSPNTDGTAAVSDATFTVGAGGNITGGVFNNTSGLAIVNGGRVSSAMTNTSVLIVNGSATVGSLDNSAAAVIDMQDGDATDTLTIAGNAVLNGSIYLDADITDGGGGTDVVAVTGTVSGDVDIFFNNLDLGDSNPIGAITVLTYGTDLGLSTTAHGLPSSGAVLYGLSNDGSGSVDLVAGANPAIGGLASGLALTQSLIGSVVNRPSSPFVSGLAAADDEPCGFGTWARGVGGYAAARGTTDVGFTNALSSELSATFGGAQFGADYSCFNGYFGGWDLSFGAIGGINAGVTSQPVYFFDGGTGAVDTSRLTSTNRTTFRQLYGGVYIGAAKDRFFADIQYRYDYATFNLQNIVAAGPDGAALGVSDQTYNSRGHTVSGSLGYAFTINEELGLNVVPTAGFSFSNVRTGDLAFENDPSDPSDDGLLQIDPINSRVVFAGATISKTNILPSGTAALNYFATATGYFDFGRPAVSNYFENVDASGNPVGTPLVSYSSNLGFFAEGSIGVNYTKLLDPGRAIPGRQLDASIRLDGRVGPSVTSAGITAQVRLQF